MNNLKKTTLILVVACLVSLTSLAFSARPASAATYWAASYGGIGWDYAYSVQPTSEGGYIAAGRTESFGAGSYDAWLLKLSSTGTVDWQKTYGGTGYDVAQSVQPTSEGGYMVAGSTNSFGAGGTDAWLLKLSSTGTVDWQKTYGGISSDEAHSVQQTSEGGYIVAGRTGSFGAGGSDVWLLKLSSTGTVDWQKTYGGTGYDVAESVQPTSDGGYMVAGWTDSFGAGGTDVWLLKLDSTGTVDWQKTYGEAGGGAGGDRAFSVQPTSEGGYLVAGSTDSFGAGNDDVWLLKLSSTGTVDWQKTYGGTGQDYAGSVQPTSDGGYMAAGYTISFGAGGGDAWLLKLSSTGTVDWQKTYGGTGYDAASSVQPTSDGGYMVAGSTTSFGVGGHDAWLLKLDSSGGVDTCDCIGTTSVSGQDTSVSPSDTSITPSDTSISPSDTSVSPSDTSVSPDYQCQGEGDEDEAVPEFTTITLIIAAVCGFGIYMLIRRKNSKKGAQTK